MPEAPAATLESFIRGIREGSALRRAKPLGETAAEQAAREARLLPPPEIVTPEPHLPPPQVAEPSVEAPAVALGPPSEAPPRRKAEVSTVSPMTTGEVETEAKRLQALNLGQYDLGVKWQPNYDVITTQDDVKAVIADAAERQRAQISASRRGVITHDELRKLAEDVGGEAAAVEAVMRREAGGELPPPEMVLAARQFVNNSADRLLELARKITAKAATDLDKVRFRRQLQLHDEFMAGFMGVRAEYGRGLNAFGIPLDVDRNPLAAARMSEILDNIGGRSVEDIAAEIADKTTAGQVAKAVKRTLSEKIGGVVKAVALGSALSGPQTQEVNLFGNALMFGMHVAETSYAAHVPKLWGAKPTVREGEAAALLFGALTGVHDALRYLGKSIATGKPVAGARTVKGELQYQDQFTARALFDKGTSGFGFLDKGINLLGAIVQMWPQRVMVPADEFSKAVFRNAEAARLGYMKALDRSEQEAINPEDFANIIRESMDNPDEIAIDEFAKRMTFQHDVAAESKFAAKMMDIARAIRKLPGGFLVAMFIKTPTAVYLEGIGKRSPLAVFNASMRRDVAAGGRARDLALAKFQLGSLTTALIASYAASGNITGYGPTDSRQRALWLANRPPYSFRYYDPFEGKWKWQSYARLAPWSAVVGAVADAVEIGARLQDFSGQAETGMKDEAVALSKATAAIVAGVTQNTLKQTFLTGVSGLVQALDDPGQYMANYLRNNAALLIPWSQFRSQVGKLEDPLIRQSWDELDYFRAKSGVPGMSQELTAKRDVFANTIEWPKGGVQGRLSPWPARDATDDPVINELLAVTAKTGRVPITMPGKKIEGMKLTAAEYDDFVVQSRGEPGPDGSTFRQSIEELIASPTYQDAPWDERYNLLHSKQEQYDSAIRGGGQKRPGKLEQQNLDFADRLAEFRIRKENAMENY